MVVDFFNHIVVVFIPFWYSSLRFTNGITTLSRKFVDLFNIIVFLHNFKILLDF